MAQCTTRTLTTATLVLSEGEARYLLALTQNYLQGHSEDEDEETRIVSVLETDTEGATDKSVDPSLN